MKFSSPTLRKTAPVIGTAFVNKCGSVGLSLLSMILVERHISSDQSSFFLATVQLAGLIGFLVGGWISDRIDIRKTVLLSFVLMGVGFLVLPHAPNFPLLLAGAILAQLGTAFYQSSIRMMLVESADFHERQEAMGWMKTGNNLGQVFSYSLGALFSKAGTSFLLLMDSGTSFLALLLGYFWLPVPKKHVFAPESPMKTIVPITQAKWRLFLGCTVLLAGFNFVYEMFMIGSAALFKIRFGESGLHIFSVMMVVNTVLCTLLAIPATKFFRSSISAFYIGLVLCALGSAFALSNTATTALIYIGMFILTLGELAFTSMSQFALMHVLPDVKAQGSIYGSALMIQALGKIFAAVLAFPLVVHGNHPALVLPVAILPLLGLAMVIHPALKKALHG